MKYCNNIAVQSIQQHQFACLQLNIIITWQPNCINATDEQFRAAPMKLTITTKQNAWYWQDLQDLKVTESCLLIIHKICVRRAKKTKNTENSPTDNYDCLDGFSVFPDSEFINSIYQSSSIFLVNTGKWATWSGGKLIKCQHITTTTASENNRTWIYVLDWLSLSSACQYCCCCCCCCCDASQHA